MANEHLKDPREQREQVGKDQAGNRAGDESGLARTELAPQRQPMAIASPFTIMGRLVDDLSRMMGSFGSRLRPSLGTSSLSNAANEVLSVPPIEMFEREGQLVIRADVRGPSKDQVVEVQDNVLIISGERSREREEKQPAFHRNERGYGRFYTAITLPKQAQVDQVSAIFRNGMLEITLPMGQRTEARRLEIKEMSEAQPQEAQQAAEQSSQTRSAA